MSRTASAVVALALSICALVASADPIVTRPPNVPAPPRRDPESHPAHGNSPRGTTLPGAGGVSAPVPPAPYTSADSARAGARRSTREELPVIPRSAPLPYEPVTARSDDRFERWRLEVLSSRAAEVWHMVSRREPGSGRWETSVLSSGVADSTWVRKLADVLGASDAFDPEGGCVPEGRASGLVLAVRFASTSGAPSVLFMPDSGCMQIYERDRPVGAAGLSSTARLLDLLGEVLSGDPDVRDARVKAASESGPKRAGFLAFDAPPVATRKVPPVYPDIAREASVDGTVVVRALIGPDGHVKDMTVTRSIPMLDAAATAAVRQWLYDPARAHGRAVSAWVEEPVRFTLH